MPDVIAKKRGELTAILAKNLRALSEQSNVETADNNIDVLSAEIVATCFKISPPTIDIERNTRSEWTVMRPGGIGGGTSYHIGYILLDWSKVLSSATTVILSSIPASVNKWFIFLPIIVAVRELASLSTRQLGENHAIVMWSMWSARDHEQHVSYSTLIGTLANVYKQYNHNSITQGELAYILSDLEQLRCIKRVLSDKWRIYEQIKISWNGT